MAVSLNDIKIKLHRQRIPVKLRMLCRWYLLPNLGSLSKLPRTSKFTHLRFVNYWPTSYMDTRLKMLSTIHFLKSRPVKKVCLYCHHFWPWTRGGLQRLYPQVCHGIEGRIPSTGEDFEVICIGSIGADFFRAKRHPAGLWTSWSSRSTKLWWSTEDY